jgi:hypothetical protein
MSGNQVSMWRVQAMSEYKDETKDETKGGTKGGKKHQFSVQRVEGLQGLQDLLNSTEGKVDSWQRVGDGATFIVVMSGIPVKEEPVVPVEEADEANGNKAKKKSA